MIDVSAWVTHATREPSEGFLKALDRHWRTGVGSDIDPWRSSAMHAFVVAHVDRATHKRRLRTTFVSAGTGPAEHGFSPMSTLVPSDMFGPQELDARFTGTDSALAEALTLAKADANLVAVPVITEAQFADVDAYHDHSASLLQATSHGAVIPFMYAPLGEDIDEVAAREDLLRANGFATYTIDADFTSGDVLDVHRNMANLMEDIFDEVAHIKADAAAFLLLDSPLWPLVVVRGAETWDPAVATGVGQVRTQDSPRS